MIYIDVVPSLNPHRDMLNIFKRCWFGTSNQEKQPQFINNALFKHP